jgi:hypothetical protein
MPDATSAVRVPARVADNEDKAGDAYDMARPTSPLAGPTSATSSPQAALRGADRAAAVVGLNDAMANHPELPDFELARVANAVSEPMEEVFGVYQDPVPAIVLALDHGVREVQLDAYEGSHERTLGHMCNCARVWTSVKPRVLDAGGDETAAADEAPLAT